MEYMKQPFIIFAVALAVVVAGWVAWHFLSTRSAAPVVPNIQTAAPAATGTSATGNAATTTAPAATQATSTASAVSGALNPFRGLYKNPF